MAGSASTNGMLFAIASLLILAWKAAGRYGLDRYSLRYIGAPWTWRKEGPRPPITPQPAPTR